MEALCSAMAFNTSLKRIFMNKNNISDPGLKSFCRIINDLPLRAIDFSSNSITDSGLEVLCKKLEHHPSLTTLSFKANKIRDDGGESMVWLLKHNKLITKVKFGQNILSHKYIEDFNALCAKNKTCKNIKKVPIFKEEISNLTIKGKK